MTRLYNAPEDFLDEMVDGFVAANSSLVRRVHGGVVRTSRTTPGQVAVITGGGSGHYPAFAGLVGEGLAHGAAMGNLFASPSWQQIRSVAKIAQNGGGVLLTYGNYAGDVLNFNHAQQRLREGGVTTETVSVTDDISSADASERHKRRGIAGDLTVLKCAGAAAAAGLPFEEVLRIANKANERTRSFGVAFSGCTLPGAAEPLFTVPDGSMAIGMGIHGEPGLREAPLPTANELASLLTDALLDPDELPLGVRSCAGMRATLLLNGLGSVKYEELFVVFARVAEIFAAHGVTVVEPECGELVTSFDMAGVSLTVFWLDEELEHLWGAPANAPGYKKMPSQAEDPQDVTHEEIAVAGSAGTASAASRAAAQLIATLFVDIADAVDDVADELGRIDAVAGDGDHGIGMRRGSRAAADAAARAAASRVGAGTLLAIAGDAWSDRAGGTSGALWGAALEQLSQALGDDAAPSPNTLCEGLRAATTAIMEFGATVGDKTVVDALVPFTDAFAAAVTLEGASITDAWTVAAEAAQEAAKGTADLIPRMGRARPHAERSLGTPDAGAVSFAIITKTIASALASRGANDNEGATV